MGVLDELGEKKRRIFSRWEPVNFFVGKNLFTAYLAQVLGSGMAIVEMGDGRIFYDNLRKASLDGYKGGLFLELREELISMTLKDGTDVCDEFDLYSRIEGSVEALVG